MKLGFYSTILASTLFFNSFNVSAQQPNANVSVKPYNAEFGYGANMGVFGNGWNDKNLATIVSKAGGNSVRPTLPESFVERWGYNIRLNEFKYYAIDLGMKDVTVFLEGPSEAHRDLTTYPGCTNSSKSFKNLYEPIWKSDGTVNPNNYYANYVYKLVQTYGPYVKNWEVVNEPDLGSAPLANWLTRAPLPNEMSNFRAPFFNYLRMLRITWEVVKKYNPDDFVTPGGIGYPEFLDAMLRYTDNPNGGAVSSQYPNKGGAYFDMVSYHVYPAYNLRKYDNAIGGFKYLHNSDFAAAQVITHKKWLEDVLIKHGYNGTTYPKKHFIVTETNLNRRTVDWRYGSDVMQRNFGIKALVLAQKNGIKQIQIYGVGEAMNAPAEGTSITSDYKLMGLYENLSRDAFGSEKLSPVGKGFKTTSMMLKGYNYDAGRTASLNMPAAVEGAAFVKNGEYVYVLWAKNPNDKTETYTQPYSFPAGMNLAKVDRFEWDYYATGKSTQQASTGLTLNTTPSFFKGISGTSTGLKSQTITFPTIGSKVLGVAPFALTATATSGLAVSFKVVSGPATLNGTTLTVTGVGTITVQASQSGNTTYNPATAVSQSFSVTSSTTSDPINSITIPAKRIEAEKYTSMSGVFVEGCKDTGGGYDVGRIDAGDWMKYSVTVTTAGTYNMSFRTAGTAAGQFEIRNSSGKVLKTVDVAATGGWQTWKTTTTQVALAAGTQTIQIYVKKSGWNFNWIEIGGSGALTQASTISDGALAPLNENALNQAWTVFPNPTTDRVQVRVGQELTGEVQLEVIDASGRIIKQFTLNKSSEEIIQTVPLEDVTPGLYFIRLKGDGISEVKKVIKQ
ncbi:carbohydrate-binding protein [Rufibacter latericius]|uniref:Carbohydrate-binding protein n=1 Tax=Rufibacter latericius TaxID=2487040 RepID=A0A3M9MLY5_9BACT|nr:carbohydrate-binding protein [Rufibacter latericius]RNI26536.1 carbohydrate-binding protein [Rufibacter latericius]